MELTHGIEVPWDAVQEGVAAFRRYVGDAQFVLTDDEIVEIIFRVVSLARDRDKLASQDAPPPTHR
jgi:hypothetical protein